MSIDQMPTVGFHDFNLRKCVLKALDDVGYKSPTPIQQQTIPYILDGHDILGQAETGSGKTAAFALPILSRLKQEQKLPQALILTPTRELAIQVAEAIRNYGKHFSALQVLPIYGGQSYHTQISGLKKNAAIVVGTPGRVMDLIKKRALNLSQLCCLVLDEADEMLNMGFIEDVEWIIEHTPKSRQTILFSATMPPPIQKISQHHLKMPKEIRIKAKTATASTIKQSCVIVPRRKKFEVLTRLLEIETFDGVIIFTRTKSLTTELAEALVKSGYSCMALNGEMQQKSRERTISRFKSGAFDIIVATDVAARGLDVDRVTHVINYNIPQNALTYIHRIGRTGRAGRHGDAITLIDSSETYALRRIEQTTRQKISKADLPSVEDIQQKRLEKFKQKLTSSLSSKEQGFYKKIIKDYSEENNVSQLDISAALASLIHNDKPVINVSLDTQSHSRFEGERKSSRKFTGNKPRRGKNDKSFARQDNNMQSYSIRVGKEHGVMPSNIVGAIANEISINSKNIGHIKIYQRHSTVDLPKDLPPKALQVLAKVWVAGQQLKISKLVR